MVGYAKRYTGLSGAEDARWRTHTQIQSPQYDIIIIIIIII